MTMTTSARAETLAEAIAQAYAGNPTLAAQRANQRALDETYVQASAGFGPQAQLQASVSHDETGGRTAALLRGPETNTSAVQLSINQPIYTGGRLSSLENAARAGVAEGAANLGDAEQSLLQSVIRVYVDVRRDQEALVIARSNLALLRHQLEEVQARFDAGEITLTDVAQTRARVAAAEGQTANAQATLEISRAAYAAVVGDLPLTLAQAPALNGFLPPSLEQALAVAEASSPRVAAARFAAEAGAARLAAVKALGRPSLSLQTRLGYSGGSVGRGSPFSGYGQEVTTSATLSFPVFSSGVIASQVRQAVETHHADLQAIEVTRRQALLEVSRAWNQLQSANAGIIAGETQAKAASLAVEGSRLEVQTGLRTTLDVLISEQDLAGAQVALANARHDAYVAAAALLLATGTLRVTDLAPGVSPYDAGQNLHRVVSPWRQVPWARAVAALDSLGAP